MKQPLLGLIHWSLQHGLNVHINLICPHWARHGFKTYCCHQSREWYFIPHLHFSFPALVDKTIHLSVFFVASIIFGFCIISCVEFQSCKLMSFKVVITLVLKPYIVLYTFIFHRPYWHRALSFILCTVNISYCPGDN